MPPVWQVGQYCRLESAKLSSRTASPAVRASRALVRVESFDHGTSGERSVDRFAPLADDLVAVEPEAELIEQWNAVDGVARIGEARNEEAACAGIGERPEDLRVFDAEAFVDALLPESLSG